MYLIGCILAGILALFVTVLWLMLSLGWLVLLIYLVSELFTLPGQYGPLLWLLWCTLVTWTWRVQFKSRNRFVRSALLVLMVISFWPVAEAGLTLLHHVGILTKEAIELPLWVEVGSLVLAGSIASHHYRELKTRNRELEIPKRLDKVLRSCGAFLKNGAPTTQNKVQYFEDLMKEFKALLESHSKRTIILSLMEKNSDDQLATIFVHPSNAPLNTAQKFALNKSAAGTAYKSKVGIYVPSTRHLGAINSETFELVGPVYEPSTNEPFRSLLCVPVLVNAGVIFVLNVASDRPRGFSPIDFDIANLATVFIAVSY